MSHLCVGTFFSDAPESLTVLLCYMVAVYDFLPLSQELISVSARARRLEEPTVLCSGGLISKPRSK